MSRAFVKEQDDIEPLPDRPVSPHPNFVTAESLASIDSILEQLRHDHGHAAADREKLASIARDVRYWAARRASAQVIAPPENPTEVQFGVTVTIRRDDGRTLTYRIVGEDEAEPARGTLSYVSPLARDMMGKSVGDVVTAGNTEAEIVEIRKAR